jgi:hypothetical protein
MPFSIDTDTPLGQDRLVDDDERRRDAPAGSGVVPVDGPAWFLLYSKPATAKLRNIAARPRVSLHLDSDGQGSDIVMVLGDAALTDAPPAHEVPGYVESTPASSSPTRGRRRASPRTTRCRCASRPQRCAAGSYACSLSA